MKMDFSYGGFMKLAIIVVSVAMVIYHVWAIAFGTPEAFFFRGTHLMLAIPALVSAARRGGREVAKHSSGSAAAPGVAYLKANLDFSFDKRMLLPVNIDILDFRG